MANHLVVPQNTSNFTTSDGDEDEDGLFVVKASLSLFLPLTLFVNSLFAVAIYKNVDISHPVFAVVFQEVVVLCAVGSFCFISLLALMAEQYLQWYLMFTIVCTLVQMFHQLSWMVITMLRYYFLIHLHPSKADAPQTVVDMTKIRRRCLAAVWLLLLPTFLAFSTGLYLSLGMMGWPETKFRQLPAWDRFSLAVGHELLINVPDAASVITYVLIRCRLHRFKKLLVAPAPEIGPEVDNAVFPFDAVSVSSASSSSASTGTRGTSVAEPEADQGTKDNEEASVMRTLKTHATLCLVDLAMPMVTLLPFDSGTFQFLWLHLQLALSFWIPLFVVGRNFRKMAQMLSFYMDRICGA